MNKFKPGDRVAVVDASNTYAAIKAGDLGTVRYLGSFRELLIGSSANAVYVLLDATTIPYPFFEDEIKRVHETD